MKAKIIFMIIVLFAMNACKTEKKTDAETISFGIYETVNVKEIPKSIIDTLKTIEIQFEQNKQQPIIGYILKSKTIDLNKLSTKNVRIVQSANTVDKDEKYFALTAIRKNAVITNSDIDKTKNKGKNVEIHFNMSGAKRWAKMTNKNKGNMVAFVIDNEIISAPYINGEIKSGIALVNGLKDESIAEKISNSINSSTFE